MDDLISRLSELRSQYNCFDESERDAYHTLSDAIKTLQAQKTGRWIKKAEGLIVTEYECSECGRSVRDDTGYSVVKDYSFCHCGARMECEDNV